MKKILKRQLSIIMVLTMLFTMLPNNFINYNREVFAATMAAGDDLVSADPGMATSSNWTTSNITTGSSGTITGASSSTYASGTSFWGTNGKAGYIYWNTSTTFPAGTYTISIYAAGQNVTAYPYLDGQITTTSQTINASSWSAASTVSLSFELTDETTGYMGV
ncbi:MAG: hypothetical protein ACI4DS_06260, partial [Eubacterium sp.]